MEVLRVDNDIVQVEQAYQGSNPAMATFNSRWKVAGALHNPKGITLNLNVPRLVTKVVLSESEGSIST